MQTRNSKVDVLLPTYNVEKYVGTTLDCITNQTFRDINILICDDCSNDGTLEIIQNYREKDSRIKIFNNSVNRGIIYTRNKLFDLSSSEYLAICDADDIYDPQRLQIQLDFLSKNKKVDALGSYFMKGVEGNSTCKLPLQNNLIKAYLHLKNVIPNPVAFIRKSSLTQRSLKYTDDFKYASDFDFWSKFSEAGRLANIDKSLFTYRIHSQQISERKKIEQRISHLNIVRKKLQKLNSPFYEKSIRSILWSQNDEDFSAVQSVCREINNVINNLSFNCKSESLVPHVYDISLRSYCKRIGLKGFKNYTKYRGLKNLVKGKYFGTRFAFDCLTTKRQLKEI